MRKQIAVDIITSGIAGEKITTHEVINSPNQPSYAALTDNDLVTKYNLNQVLPDATSTITGKINAGTTIPAVIPFTFGTDPQVSMTVKLASDGTGKTKTNRQITLAYDLVFSSNALTTLVSVNIWGNDDGTGKFNEDTWYSIRG